jgi:hypothetical protein
MIQVFSERLHDLSRTHATLADVELEQRGGPSTVTNVKLRDLGTCLIIARKRCKSGVKICTLITTATTSTHQTRSTSLTDPTPEAEKGMLVDCSLRIREEAGEIACQ